jgi:hypothetical protein
VQARYEVDQGFRVGGKVFASLAPAPVEEWGMVKVAAEQQATLLRAAPEVFRPATGAWGRSGCTIVTLREAPVAAVKEALGWSAFWIALGLAFAVFIYFVVPEKLFASGVFCVKCLFAGGIVCRKSLEEG